jgi:hypothetical protein
VVPGSHISANITSALKVRGGCPISTASCSMVGRELLRWRGLGEAAVRVQERAARKEVVLSGAFEKVMEAELVYIVSVCQGTLGLFGCATMNVRGVIVACRSHRCLDSF